MTIEGIVCQRGTDLDLFHPSYFKSVSELMAFMVNQRVYLYGWHNVNHSPTTVVVDTKKFGKYSIIDKEKFETPTPGKKYYIKRNSTYEAGGTHLDNGKLQWDNVNVYEWLYDISSNDFTLTSRNIFLNVAIQDKWIVKNPQIPPEEGFISDNSKVDMWNLRIRFLHERDEYTPKYYSVDQSPEIMTQIHSGDNDLELCKSSTSFSTHKSIFFVNGLCCYPTKYLDPTYGDSVKLSGGRTYLRNQKDRARGVVIVDFSKLADIEFIKVSSCEGTLDLFKLPEEYDPTKFSFLLIIDGRMFLPNEFSVLHSTKTKTTSIAFDSSKYKDIYALDRLCCSYSFKGMMSRTANDVEDINEVTRYFPMTRNLVTDKPDLYNNDNSFVIVIKKKGLRVIRHRSLRGPDERQFLKEPVTGEQLHHVTFNSSAAGLLFDAATRSVIDYTEETNDLDFYVGGTDIKYVLTDDEYPIEGKTYYKKDVDENKVSYKKTESSDYDVIDGRKLFKEDVSYFESKPQPQRWSTKMLYLKHNTPLERWGNPNNVMSASASMHDNKTVRGDAQVIWPKYTMLDFIFEG